jgi:hypothetical protein
VLDERFDHVDSELDRRRSDRSLGNVSLLIAAVHEHMFQSGVCLINMFQSGVCLMAL